MVIIFLINFFYITELKLLHLQSKISVRHAFAEGTNQNLKIQWETYFMLCFYCITISRITELLYRGKINISNIDIVIIHVGTNNISSCGYNHFLLWGFNTQT